MGNKRSHKFCLIHDILTTLQCVSRIVIFKGAVRWKEVVPLSQTFCLLTQKAFSLNPAEAAGSAHSMLRLDATPPQKRCLVLNKIQNI